MAAKILAVCLSREKGIRKTEVEKATLAAGYGMEGDAHAGDWHRQVSFLATESVEKMRRDKAEIPSGAFGENFLTEGIELAGLATGTLLKLAGGPVLRVTQIGKECHDRCEIYYTMGDCVMPREGIFCEVVVGGDVWPGDSITIEDSEAR
ncbi:MAG: MOSC domain-containing protein [Planctomycetota bacterium]|jgi:MOSC domain-containing protein YiiM